MKEITANKFNKLIIKFGFDKIYTETVKSNGGNSCKINCRKGFEDREAVVFILSEKGV